MKSADNFWDAIAEHHHSNFQLLTRTLNRNVKVNALMAVMEKGLIQKESF